MRQVAEAVRQLQAAGFLLEEDAERYVEAAKSRDPLNEAVPLAPLALSKAMPSPSASVRLSVHRGSASTQRGECGCRRRRPAL